MTNNNSKQTNPLQTLFEGIEKIIDFMEVKDIREAEKYETPEIREQADMWMNARSGDDSYISYREYWNISMFQEVVPNVRLKDIKKWMQNPSTVPMEFHNTLLNRGREAFLNKYEEKNDYYRMLNGVPPTGTPKSEFIYLTDPMRNQLHASDLPVHLLSPLIQNNYMGTDEYKQVVANNPDKKYLKYLGLYKIDTFVARRAKDFEIIRYPLNRSDINPNLIREFSSLYDKYREYVMVVLYNEHLEGVYHNYRTFMGMLINMFVLMQVCNKSVEAVNNKNYIDDSVLHIMLSMYDIPNTLLMTNEVRRSLCINMLKLVREKGTDDVYYDLIEILGYQDIIISKLMLMKGQKFDEDNNYAILDETGKPLHTLADIDESDSRINVEPYFVQVDLKDTNPYETITSGNAKTYDYHKIVDNDPTWWDMDDTKEILMNSDYSITDSKYIVIEAVIHQIKYLFESIYFTRLILDNKSATDEFMIEIPEIFGTESVSIYDLIIYVISATCMNNGLTGDILSNDSKLLATAGFNFDMDLDSFTEFINTTKYVDKDRVMGFMENLTIHNKSDINRIFNDVMYPMREWLEYKIANASVRQEYIEYEAIYRSLYTYDASRNMIMSSFKKPIEIIREKYGLTNEEMVAFQHFYPRTMRGDKVTVETYNESRYPHPFVSHNNEIEWWIHIIIDTPYGDDDRGYLYFHDILNHPDLRELTNPDGTRVFMDYNDGEVGWEINRQAVEKALYLLDHLEEDSLYNAFFPINVPIPNSGGKSFSEGEYLPASIRTGIYKEILKEKLMMDMQGLAVPPTTYLDYLYRKNEKLYNLLVKGDRFHLDKNAWLNDVMKIVLAVETELNIHMKYFEQSVLGSDLFLKPLITLIKHFKSTFVDFARAGLTYVFGDKVDAGGNSNMFKIFDEVKFIIHFITLSQSGFESQFGLYDTEHLAKFHIEMNDRSEMFRMTSHGFDHLSREVRMGSIHMVDEVKFFKNGEEVDPNNHASMWYNGEPGNGRWSDEDNIIFRIRKDNAIVKNPPVDLDGWKNFVESYNPIE